MIMPLKALKHILAAMLIATWIPAVGWAQDEDDQDDADSYEQDTESEEEIDEEGPTLGAGEPDENLPPAQDDSDPQPTPPAPELPPAGVVEQAGVGGQVAYARSGVLEFGGFIGLLLADELTQFTLSPSVGWFVVNNFELSLLLGLDMAETDVDSATFFTAMIEPSLHLPFTETVFGFFGVGTGVSVDDDQQAGFVMAPRLGLNILVGRSGILTPAVRYMWSATDTLELADGTDLIGIDTAVAFNLGWTVMW
jgi:hypothetical protein